MFSAVQDEASSGKPKPAILNSELDDLPLPDETEFPSSDSLLSLTTNLDEKVKELESAPLAPVVPDTPDTERAKEPSEDLISVTEDVNAHGLLIEDLASKFRAHESKIAQLVTVDSGLRKVETEVKEMRRDMRDLKETVKQLRESMTHFQTATGQKIADVERRAATSQLSVTASPDASLSVPPQEVFASRLSAVQGSVDPKKTTVIDLSDF